MDTPGKRFRQRVITTTLASNISGLATQTRDVPELAGLFKHRLTIVSEGGALSGSVAVRGRPIGGSEFVNINQELSLIELSDSKDTTFDFVGVYEAYSVESTTASLISVYVQSFVFDEEDRQRAVSNVIISGSLSQPRTHEITAHKGLCFHQLCIVLSGHTGNATFRVTGRIEGASGFSKISASAHTFTLTDRGGSLRFFGSYEALRVQQVSAGSYTQAAVILTSVPFSEHFGHMLVQELRWSSLIGLPGNVWHSNNDGAGSGLDADLLDGFDSSAFARKANNETIIGSWTFNANVAFASSGQFADGTPSFPSITFIDDIFTGFFRPAASTIGVSVGGGRRVIISNGVDSRGCLAVVSDANNARVEAIGTASASPVFQGIATGGTTSAPTATPNNTLVSGFGARGHDGGGIISENPGQISFVSTENWTASGWGTEFRLGTTPNGSTTRTDRLAVSSAGALQKRNGSTVNWSLIDYSTLNPDLSSAGACIIFAAGTHTITTNTTWSGRTIRVEQGALIVVNSGVTLTINANVEAGLYHIFSVDTGASLVLGRACKEAYPEWWGADNTGAANSSIVLQRAIDSCTPNRVPLVFTGGTFLVNSGLTVSGPLPIETRGNCTINCGGSNFSVWKFTDFNYVQQRVTLPSIGLGNDCSGIYLEQIDLANIFCPNIGSLGAGNGNAIEIVCTNPSAARNCLNNLVEVSSVSNVNRAVLVFANRNDHVIQGNVVKVGFATTCLIQVEFFQAGGVNPFWDRNRFEFGTIDPAGRTTPFGAFGLATNATGGTPKTTFICHDWFGGFPASGTFLSGTWNELTFRVQLVEPVGSYSKMNVSGTGNTLDFSLRHGKASAAVAARPATNQRNSYNGGNPTDQNRVKNTFTTTADVANGATLGVYVYSPFVDGNSERLWVDPIELNGFVCDSIVDNHISVTSEIVIRFRNVSGASIPSGTTLTWYTNVNY